MEPIISADQTILLIGVVLLIVTVAITLEQRYKWASFIGSFFICIFGGFLLSNLNIIPHAADAWNAIDGIILLVALPMFLFKADIKAIVKQSGKLFGLFHVAAIGSLIASMIMGFLFASRVDLIQKCLPILCAGQVGGTVNCVAVGNIIGIDSGFLDTYLVADNFSFCFMVLILNILHRSKFIKKFLPRPETDALEAAIDQEALRAQGKTIAAGFWGGKEISLKDIATCLCAAFMIVGIAQALAALIQSFGLPTIINQLFGNVYMMITLITVGLATAFPKLLGSIKGAMEMGNICFLMWFTVVGIFGDLGEMLKSGVVIMLMCLFSFCFNMLICIVGAKLLHCTWEEAVAANMASVGGPPTVAAIAGSFGWTNIIIPGMLVGLWGYVIGNYAGIIIANMFVL